MRHRVHVRDVQGRCAVSEHEHTWTFWGDDPYVICADPSCDAIKDAFTGGIVR